MTAPAQPLPPINTVPPEEPMPEGVVVGLIAYEALIAALVLSLLGAWLATVSAAVLASFLRFKLPPDPTAIWSTVPQWDRSLDRLMDALKRIAQTGWEDTARQLGLQDLPFNPDDAMLADTLQRTRNLMVRTPDEVYQTIIAELGKGHDANENPAQLAARVRNVLSVTGTQNWPARAQTVAVTEVHRAFNFGGIAAAQRAQMRDLSVMTKTWIHKHDLRVRAGHRISQTVPVNQPFIVNEEPLIAPGDPTGSPGNVINCRCKARYRRGTSGRQ
jgi:hypothetical protein